MMAQRCSPHPDMAMDTIQIKLGTRTRPGRAQDTPKDSRAASKATLTLIVERGRATMKIRGSCSNSGSPYTVSHLATTDVNDPA